MPDIVNQLSGILQYTQNEVGDFVFYDHFYKLCQAAGVTPTEVARTIGIRQSTVSMWKKQGTTPKYETLQKLADFFGTSVDYLLGKTDLTAIPPFLVDKTIADTFNETINESINDESIQNQHDLFVDSESAKQGFLEFLDSVYKPTANFYTIWAANKMTAGDLKALELKILGVFGEKIAHIVQLCTHMTDVGQSQVLEFAKATFLEHASSTIFQPPAVNQDKNKSPGHGPKAEDVDN